MILAFFRSTRFAAPIFKLLSAPRCSRFLAVFMIAFQAMRKQLLRAQGLFATCPSCLTNFNTFWCHFTCSPNQSMFVEVMNVWNLVRHDFIRNGRM